MNNTIVWVVIVVVIAGGLFFFLGNGDYGDSETEDVSEDVVATENGDGENAPEGVMEDGTLSDEEAEAMMDSGEEDSSHSEGSENGQSSGDSEEEEESSSGSEGDSMEEKPVSLVVVTYTDNGFEPKTVEINLGDTVRWVNESGSGMWVGSDIHPTHTQYPEKSSDDCLGSSFDQCATGASYEFTFNQTGSHGYHNHVSAGRRGTVVVN